jgi:hypothetical protein
MTAHVAPPAAAPTAVFPAAPGWLALSAAFGDEAVPTKTGWSCGLRRGRATPCRTGRRGLPAGCVRRRACLVWTSRAGPYALPSLLAFAEPGHILFGRDYPWAPTEVIESFNDPRFRCKSPGVAHR